MGERPQVARVRISLDCEVQIPADPAGRSVWARIIAGDRTVLEAISAAASNAASAGRYGIQTVSEAHAPRAAAGGGSGGDHAE